MKSKFTTFLFLSFIVILCLTGTTRAAMTDTEIDRKVAELLAQMTLEEKVGQMTQVTSQVVSSQVGKADQVQVIDPDSLRKAIVDYKVGSLLNVWDVALSLEHWQEFITQVQDIALNETRLGIPVIYGIDAIHGANYIKEATLFPQSIAIAATRNTEIAQIEGEITALECRAAGLPWNFNPVLGVGRTPLWPRQWETYGEDPYLCGEMGAAYIIGQEGDDVSAPDKVVACMKHYLGYSFPLSGKDRTPAWIPERMLRDIFVPPFKRACEVGVHSMMINSGEINGIPTHSDEFILKDLLIDELGFKGFNVSDWSDINNLYERDHIATSFKDAVRIAVNAGVDMSMVPTKYDFYDYLIELVNEGEVSMERIDEAVGRILKVKYQMGLFDNPYPVKEFTDQVGRWESWAKSLQAAQEAITLLKNEDDFLPLKKDTKVLVTGPAANLRSLLNSGWTYRWQGDEEALYPEDQKTILQAIEDEIGQENVIFEPGVEYDQAIDIEAAVAAAKKVDVAILCLGERAYCETPGNIHDLNLPHVQWELAWAIQKTGTPVVLVMIEGRPRIITPIVEDSKAVVMGYLPGPMGGIAIADVLFGDFNPCGKLPMTYPMYPNSLNTYDGKPSDFDQDNKYAFLYPFGHGLSYTTFEFSGLDVTKKVSMGDEIEVSVLVKNTGDRQGKAVVELYLNDVVRSVTAPVKQLKRFTGVWLEPGKSERVYFTLNQDDLSFWNREMKFVAEPGEFKIFVGDLEESFILKP